MYDDGSNVSADRILVLFNLTFSCPVVLSKLFSPLVQLGVSGRVESAQGEQRDIGLEVLGQNRGITYPCCRKTVGGPVSVGPQRNPL